MICVLERDYGANGRRNRYGIIYKQTYKPGAGYKIDPKCKTGGVLYADDFVIVTETKEQPESIYQKLTSYLQKRGVTHIQNGFDFLDFSLRPHKTEQSNKF